jgi:hypothetical protein
MDGMGGIPRLSEEVDLEDGEVDQRTEYEWMHVVSTWIKDNKCRLDLVLSDLSPEVQVRWSSFTSETSRQRLVQNECRESLGRLIEAVERICYHEPSNVVDSMFTRVKKIEYKCSENVMDAQMVQGGTMEMRVAAHDRMVELPTVDQLMAMIMSAALDGLPQFFVPLLESTAECGLEEVLRLTSSSDEWYAGCQMVPRYLMDGVRQRLHSGDSLLAVFWNTHKINKFHTRQKRGLAVGNHKFYTFDADFKRFRTRDYSDILAIDIHDVQEGKCIFSQDELHITIWLTDPEDLTSIRAKLGNPLLPVKRTLLRVSPPEKRTSVPLDGLKLKISPPDPPHLPHLIHARPPRLHPATVRLDNNGQDRDCHSLRFACDHLSKPADKSPSGHKSADFNVVEGNFLVLELAYVLYAAWRSACPSRALLPFWTVRAQAGLLEAAEIPDLKPQL